MEFKNVFAHPSLKDWARAPYKSGNYGNCGCPHTTTPQSGWAYVILSRGGQLSVCHEGISDFTVSFAGENNTHTTSYGEGQWHCSCSFFAKWGLCSHTMALQKILVGMLPEEALSPEIAEKLGIA